MRLFRLLPRCLLALSIGRAEVDLVRVWPGYREAGSFVGIGEYFGQPESTGNRVVWRSQPASRGGYYWLIRARSDVAVPEATVEIAVIRPGQTDPEFHRFQAELPAARSVVLLPGLTGGDWPDAAVRPLAWRIRILDSTGTARAVEQSFLWSLPEATTRE